MVIDYKRLIFWGVFSLIFLGIVIYLIVYLASEPILEITWPTGNEILEAGETYKITWRAKNVNKVGILLIKGEESKWIAQNLSGRTGEYDWSVFVWQQPDQNYRIAILEYPWQEGKKISYSNFFTIIGPKFASCDEFSIENEWPYIPSDYPNLKRVFITEASFNGDLGGLEGADAKCQSEADKKNLGGTWRAFLGDDRLSAMERLNLEGIFVEATPQGVLPGQKTCYSLLGRNFNEFFKKLTDQVDINASKFRADFLDKLDNIWLGRVTTESKKECLFIIDVGGSEKTPTNYSLTTTCQNWTTNNSRLPGYPPKKEETTTFPECYTLKGEKITAAGLGGLSTGINKETKHFIIDLGRNCAGSHYLLCIEQ